MKKTERFQLRLTKEVKEELEKQAKEANRSINNYIETLILKNKK